MHFILKPFTFKETESLKWQEIEKCTVNTCSAQNTLYISYNFPN